MVFSKSPWELAHRKLSLITRALKLCSLSSFFRPSLFKCRGLYIHNHRARVLSQTTAQGYLPVAPSRKEQGLP
ncbi:hypothetical protein F7725_016729 [Dissostichus mawsoni]|uniref:Uncharacterized protein n=1 Tax=Dissostichus mawsoni TaxID=36200 RepID=A0A7J5Z340_DISMA|nr:hypothetical protein F7725_016729 [Dissostichus mawsoni]